MKIPDEIKIIRANKSLNASHDESFVDGLNAGFAAFAESEMMRNMISYLNIYALEGVTGPGAAREVLDKYKKWLGEK